VEAARDGRLGGKDLASALRHRSSCAECASEERALAELGTRIRDLPSTPLDALALRRARQRLSSDWNEHVLHAPTPRGARRVALVFALGAAAVVACSLVGRSLLRSPSPTARVLEVTAKPGTRWTEQRSPGIDRLLLQEGFASIVVRDHGSERVFVTLPDGEIEDLGTVFEVEVQGRRTTHIAVKEGRVSVRLNGRPAFELGAGQAWQREAEAEQASEPKPVESARASTGPSAGEPSRTPVPKASSRASAVSAASQQATPTRPDSAEDDAYLHIVDLLRTDQVDEARAQAAQYLTRFPNGFRRLEVRRIATSR
jgi:hypothetical protein